ncbi:MAG: Fe-S cluster assembly protein SufD [Verrucomicrobia bacterium]|nr:Fe-S cluster assembly protein SufD [Verrucomicrobiota bacterium]
MMAAMEPRAARSPAVATPLDQPGWPRPAEVREWAAGPAWLLAKRQAGLARFQELGWPTLEHEDWRFTNLAPLAEQPWPPAPAPTEAVLPAERLADFALAQLPGDRLVFVDGHFSRRLSRVRPQPHSVRVSSLAQALAEAPAWSERWLGREGALVNALTALNEAYFTDGLVVSVPKGRAIEEPVQLLHLSTGGQARRASHLRNLIVTEADTRLTVVENYVSLGAAATLTNTVTTVVGGANSVVEHLRFQDESAHAFHLGAVEAELGRGASFVSHSFALGARLSRQNLRVILGGEGLEAVLNGLYLTGGERLADHHMIVDHAAPRCVSHEYFNGILAGRSKGVFHGRILVRPGAQKTDAKQTNKNMLLSDEATANTKPQLEIYADDVKCTHGATIGQLQPEAVFYLRARGLPRETARRMLIHAFAGEIIERIRSTAMREELDRVVWDRLEQDEQVHVGP